MGRGTDNIKYKELEVKENIHIPEFDIEYPEDDSSKKIAGVRYNGTDVTLDENYPYLDDSFEYKWNHFWNRLLLTLVVKPLNRIRYGLRIDGSLKQYRNTFPEGAITVCNHVYRWDLVCILNALGFKNIWFPIYGDHMRSKDAWFMRYVGGIPVPESKNGMRPFNEAFDELHRRKEWIHVFPEAASWRFYKPLRSFKKGAFTMAFKYGMPIIPCVISYRKRTGIYRLFDKKHIPLLTLHVGTPILPDTTRARKDEVSRMLREAHSQMVEMAGIVNNPWPAE
ncbi:MAG: lysophospholipid acyltransferase family protein [Candidatus Cryptobacteroides sp.]